MYVNPDSEEPTGEAPPLAALPSSVPAPIRAEAASPNPATRVRARTRLAAWLGHNGVGGDEADRLARKLISASAYHGKAFARSFLAHLKLRMEQDRLDEIQRKRKAR